MKTITSVINEMDYTESAFVCSPCTYRSGVRMMRNMNNSTCYFSRIVIGLGKINQRLSPFFMISLDIGWPCSELNVYV
jgi:hypothetical protein